MSDPTGTHPFAPFEWMLSLRYLRARRQEGFISVIAGFSFLGIMLGVATLIIVMAVMNGFRKELLDKILGPQRPSADPAAGSPLTDWQEVAERISQAFPASGSPCRSSRARRWRPRRSTPRGVLVRGVRGRADLARLASIASNIRQGTLDGFDDRAGGGDRQAARRSTVAAGRRQRDAGGAARRGHADGHDAAHQGLQDRRGVRDRHVGIRCRLRVHAAHRGAGLFQSRRRRHRDRGLCRQSGPDRPLPQARRPRRPPAGRSS